MVATIVIGALAVAGGYVLLRMLMGGRSTEQSKRESERGSLQAMTKVRAYEQQVELLNRRIKSAPDRQRELMAKRMELLLKQKERLKHRAERLVKKS